MGNTLVTDNTDKRFNDSLLAKEVKKIIINQEGIYNKKPINIHLAKACCKPGVIGKNVKSQKNTIISIGFPKVIEKN